MSKHRIKSFAVEDDFEDGYDDGYDESGYAVGEEDGLTAEDTEKLRVGTVQVRSALGRGFASISDKEVQDTLWHYYYDIAKSITYLKNKAGSNQNKQVKPKPEKAAPQPPGEAEIRVEPVFPHLGLLGGSSAGDNKISKLAALAAKRRRKENEKQEISARKPVNSAESSASSLDKLRIATKRVSASRKEPPLQPRQNLESETSLKQTQDRSSPNTKSFQPKQQGDENRTEDQDQPDSVHFEASLGALRAKPSLFARTLLDSGRSASHFPSEPLSSLPDPAVSFFDFSKPSPDDIVLKAQNFKGSKTQIPVKQQKPTKVKESPTNNMADLSITEPAKVQSKNLDVLAEYRKVTRKNAANFVVIGHVDSGKSTLMGRLLFDLKAIDERTMEKYKNEAEKMGKGSFAFAWILDQGTEERARGVTMDIATNKFETDRTSFTILDAPGHRDFVPNMIAGASQADFAVLVIDASTGEFEAGLRGQTKEHALLVRSMGVSKIVVAVNKMDRTDWSEERFQDIRQQMLAFLTTAGFKSEKISFVPCSGLQGDNIFSRSAALEAGWYSGQTLVEELDASEPTDHALDKPLRMTIGDVFQDSLQNPLSVSGRIEAGSLQVGDQIVVMPSGEKAYVRNLQVDDEPSEWAVAGHNAILSLTEIEEDKISVGDMLCSTISPVSNVSSFTAKVLAFEHLLPMPLDIHKGRLHVPGRISRLAAVLDKVDGSIVKNNPKVVQPGSVARVVVGLDSPAPIEGGRIVLRANGETVAAGLLEY